MKKQKKFPIAVITKAGILGGIASIFTLVHISVWFAPPFYKIDLADAIVLIGGYALGPASVLYMQIVKILLNLILDGTTTFFIGEFANFLMGLVFVLPASIIFDKKKDFKFVIIGIAVSVVIVCIISSLVNVYITIPAYSKAFGIPIDEIINMGSIVNPKIVNMQTLVLFGIVPFNVLKCTINSVISITLYKKLSQVLKLEQKN